MLDMGELHRDLLHSCGGGYWVWKREGQKNDMFVELFCKGVNSSFQGCCFSSGLAVGLSQGHLFQGHLIYLFCQVLKFVEDCLEGTFYFMSNCTCAPLHFLQHVIQVAINLFKVLLLVVAEFDDSLFDSVEVLFILVVHRARFIDLFAEEDNVVLYPFIVLKLL
jgi:hypothetical protein